MLRTVTATEAKAKLADLMKWAMKTGDSVLVQSRGNPQVVIVPFSEYEELQRAKERNRRAEAMARLQAYARENQTLNQDMTSEAAEELAEETTTEAIAQLAAKGRIHFERPTP